MNRIRGGAPPSAGRPRRARSALPVLTPPRCRYAPCNSTGTRAIRRVPDSSTGRCAQVHPAGVAPPGRPAQSGSPLAAMVLLAVSTSTTRASSTPRSGEHGGSRTTACAHGIQSGKPCGPTGIPSRYRMRSIGEAGWTIWNTYRPPGITRGSRAGEAVPCGTTIALLSSHAPAWNAETVPTPTVPARPSAGYTLCNALVR